MPLGLVANAFFIVPERTSLIGGGEPKSQVDRHCSCVRVRVAGGGGGGGGACVYVCVCVCVCVCVHAHLDHFTCVIRCLNGSLLFTIPRL